MPFEVIFQIILPFHQKGWPPLPYTIYHKTFKDLFEMFFCTSEVFV